MLDNRHISDFISHVHATKSNDLDLTSVEEITGKLPASVYEKKVLIKFSKVRFEESASALYHL